MFVYDGSVLHVALLQILNVVLRTGNIPSDWIELLFIMLPKFGDLLNASNWRPIAMLDITYKIFAKMPHVRLAPTLERQQSDEQVGFRPRRSCDDALLVLE